MYNYSKLNIWKHINKILQILYDWGLFWAYLYLLFSVLVEICQALAVSASVFLRVRRMDLDPGWGAWTQTSRSKNSTCDPVGSSSVLGLECDVGLAACLNSLWGKMGIS